jgi:hypothetical protein
VAGPRIRIGSGYDCCVVILLDGPSLALVGPNACRTFLQNC